MDIFLLIFFCIRIGKTARAHGLNPARWRWRLVFSWLGFEFCGFLLGVMLFGYDKNNMLGLAAFALACAFGGYLIVKASLHKKIRDMDEEDINNIGNTEN